MFNDGALGVNAPLWNKPELHLWVEASSYSDGGLTTGKALPAGRRIFKMSVCTTVAYLFQLSKTDKCPKAISNVFCEELRCACRAHTQILAACRLPPACLLLVCTPCLLASWSCMNHP